MFHTRMLRVLGWVLMGVAATAGGGQAEAAFLLAVRAAIAPNYAANTPFTNRQLRHPAPSDTHWARDHESP